MSKLIVHPSGLPTFLDCEGRWAASALPSLRRKVSEGLPFFGSVFGKIAHAAVADMLRHKKTYSITPSPDNYILLAQREILEAFDKGLKTDDTTKTKEAALIQIEAVIRESLYSYVSRVEPLMIEETLKIELKGYVLDLAMTPDVILQREIDDHKFPRFVGDYHAQGGGYFIGAEAVLERIFHLFNLNVIQRVNAKNNPADLEVITYRRDDCLEAAWYAIKLMNEKLPYWKEDKDPRIWRKNPNSKYCGQTTCGLWGTPDCNQWTDKKGVLKKK